ncbi:unnamed protein product [Ectocarpus sp. 12 AP-2014]
MGDADRKIPAVKLFVSQLNNARQPVEAAGLTGLEESNLVGLVLMGIEFTRVWVQQGIVIEVNPAERSFIVDDNTGTVTAVVPGVGLDGGSNDAGHGGGDADGLPKQGQHVLMVGAVEAPCDDNGQGRRVQRRRSSCRRYRVLCDVVKDVGPESPNRDALWGLEVIDFWMSRLRNPQG